MANANNQGWWVIATSIFYQACTFGVFLYSFTFWIAPWSAEFNLPTTEVVMAMSMGNVTASLAAVWVGRLVDKVPVVKLVCSGLMMFALGFFLISIASAFWQIILVYSLLFGVGITTIGQLTAHTLAIRWFVKRRSVAIGWVSIGSSLGGLLVPPLVTQIAGDIGWRQTHQLLALVFAFVVLPIAAWQIREPALVREPKVDPQDQLLAPPVSTLQRYQQVLTQRRFWLIYMVLTPMVLGVYLFVVNLAPFGHDLGISVARTALVMSACSLAMIGGKIGSGFLFDHWSTSHVLNLILVVLIGSLALLSLTPSYPVLLIAGALLGASAGSYLTVSGTLVTLLYSPREFGGVMGLVLLSNIVVFLTVPVSSAMREATGSYVSVWLALMALSALGLLATRRVNALVLLAPA
ncbi:MAG: MFS transporter [Gammaproteobacteria bacterium]|nr:MFS transporter [Gammaproteobacteria bacterium]